MNTFNPYVNYRASDGTENPCRRDCPKRGPFCRLGCPDYAKYRTALDKDNKINARLGVMTVAYKALEDSYARYRQNVREDAGERKRGRKGYNY